MKKALFDPVAHFYDQEQRHFRHDIPFYVDYAKKCRGEVLELACGTGRVLIPIAKAGARITGLDISREMLDIARTKVDRLGKTIRKRVDLVQGDMTNFRFHRKFALIIIAFRSFQIYTNKEDQGRCLESIKQHLANNGRLIVDLFVPKHEYLAKGRIDQDLGKFYDETMKKTITKLAKTTYDLARQTLVCDFSYAWTDNNGRRRRQIWSFELGYLFRYETELLLEKHGFKIVDVFGDFKESPYNYYSGEQIFVARKK